MRIAGIAVRPKHHMFIHMTMRLFFCCFCFLRACSHPTSSPNHIRPHRAKTSNTQASKYDRTYHHTAFVPMNGSHPTISSQQVSQPSSSQPVIHPTSPSQPAAHVHSRTDPVTIGSRVSNISARGRPHASQHLYYMSVKSNAISRTTYLRRPAILNNPYMFFLLQILLDPDVPSDNVTSPPSHSI